MLRVFEPQSPMSVGTYTVSAFDTFAIPGGLLVELAFGWVFAGHASARDPEAPLAAQRRALG